MKNRVGYARVRAGFTLIELLVVVLIIGILAAIATPQYFKVVEKGRFAEAVATFGPMKGAQERYYLKNSAYTSVSSLLDLAPPALVHFTASTWSAGATSWSLALARVGGGNPYTITYLGPAGTMTCSGTGSDACNEMKP